MSRALIAALKKLLAEPAQVLPASQFTPSQRTDLDELARRTGAVQAIRQGRGLVYQIKHLAVLEQQLKILSPDKQNLTAPSRAQNIAAARSSKSANHQHSYSYVLLRAAAPAIWQNTTGEQFDLYKFSQIYGAQALQIGDKTTANWRTSGQLWLVENQALFDDLSWLPANEQPQSVLWYAGQLPNLLIQWLATKQPADEIVLFADYDGVGLKNYVRLKQAVTETQFWLMPNVMKKLERFGNNELWQNSFDDFTSAYQALTAAGQINSELAALTEHMRKLGLGLEQEAVWLTEPC